MTAKFFCQRIGRRAALSLLAVLCLAGLIGGLHAATHKHIDGTRHVPRRAGAHPITLHGGHQAHVHVNRDGKVSRVTARHKNGRALPTRKVYRKVKTRAVAATESAVQDIYFTSTEPTVQDIYFTSTEPTDMLAQAPGGVVIIQVGYGCCCNPASPPAAQVWVYLWFPEGDCSGGRAGCSPYTPPDGSDDDSSSGGW
jgi:hypothetical protein